MMGVSFWLAQNIEEPELLELLTRWATGPTTDMQLADELERRAVAKGARACPFAEWLRKRGR